MKVVADVVVVGAGVVGCSAAFHLGHLGRGRTIVVEKGAIGSGMTKRSSGLIRTHFSNSAQARLALTSLRYFQNWKEMIGGSCGYSPTGLALIVRESSNATLLKRNVADLRAIGVRTELLAANQLRALEPGIRAEDSMLAAYEPDSGYADPVAATLTLATRAKDMGVLFKTGTLVKSIRIDHGRIIAVETNTGPIETMSVVVAAGAWTDRLLKGLGLEIGIRPERAQVAFFERPSALGKAHLAYMDAVTGVYLRPHTFGLSAAGRVPWMRNAPSSKDPGASSPDRIDELVPAEFVDDLRKRISARLPAMIDARFIRGHAGVYDSGPNGRPVLGLVPGVHGLVIAAGFGASGFALAPAVGACVDEIVTEGGASTMDLHSLAPADQAREQVPSTDLDYVVETSD